MPRDSVSLGAALLALLLASAPGQAQNLGSPPLQGVDPLDVYAAFRLPPLTDAPGTPLATLVSGLQTGARAKQLKLTSASGLDAWNSAQTLLMASGPPASAVPARSPIPAVFAGTKASALNQMLARPGLSRLKVTSANLLLDQPIQIQRQDLLLDLGTTQFRSTNSLPYMVRIENASGISLLGGNFVSGDTAVLVSNSTGVSISGARISALTGAGMVVTGSTQVTLRDNNITGLPLAGIMLCRRTSQTIVRNNEITGNQGFSNWMAGIVATDREVDVTANPRGIFSQGTYWVVAQGLTQRSNPPHDNLIAWNHVVANTSSGIYSDGGVRNVIYGNVLSSNAKEGLCLDNGSEANVVAWNRVTGNGKRWGQPDAVLAQDFILAAGRLPDGTAAEKVPGISIDNAIYNIVFANDVSHNSGGGIKTVRTAYFNTIGLNKLLDNNDGASDKYHYFGIELGAATSDAPDPGLDFTPSRGNILFANSIRGNHYAGIFFAADSDQNTILDNTILDATDWALESAKVMPNITLNNYTNLHSRNIGSGLDPALLVLGQPVNDPPAPQ